MRPVTIAISIAALALPLLAATEDSPLVKAAKASGRLNKKPGVVITNETLAVSGGHLSTNGSTTPFVKPAEAYANAPANNAPAPAPAAAPAPSPVANTHVMAPTNASTYQPAAATTYQPAAAQTTQLGTASTTAVSYAGTTQPEVVPAKPPQP